MQTLITIIVFILILGAVVLVHEFGHFITAKAFGVYCGEFSIGMGPKLFSKKIGETEYEIRALPIGGFVSMAGEADNDIAELKDIPFERTINGISCWKKVIVFLAGVMMNFILSIVLLIGVYSFVQVQDDNPIIGSLANDGPAMMAGIEAGDRIVEISYGNQDYSIVSYDDIRQVMGQINLTESESVMVTVVIERDGNVLTKEVNSIYSEDSGSYILGILPAYHQLNFLEAVSYALSQFKTLSLLIFTTLAKLFSDTANTIGQLSGPAGIFTATAEITATGSIANILVFLALISTNVGIFNLMPIPGLDGCQVLFAIVEKIIGRELPTKVRYALQLAGLALVFGLLIYVTINDISRIFG